MNAVIETPRSVPVPADLDAPDRLLWGLNGRQVALLAPVSLGALLVWYRFAGHVELALLLVVTAPPLGIVAALALGRVDGMDLDRLLFAALRRPRRTLAAGVPDAAVDRLAAAAGQRPPRPITGPVRALAEDGMLDLGSAGFAQAVAVGTVNFSLRSDQEQANLVTAFAGLLHSLNAHVQLLVATRPVDLTGFLAVSVDRAKRLPAPRLAAAASAHTAWLEQLLRRRRLLERQVTVVVRASDAEACEHAADQVVSFADSIGVEARRLDAAQLAERVRASIDPYGTPVRRLS